MNLIYIRTTETLGLRLSKELAERLNKHLDWIRSQTGESRNLTAEKWLREQLGMERNVTNTKPPVEHGILS